MPFVGKTVSISGTFIVGLMTLMVLDTGHCPVICGANTNKLKIKYIKKQKQFQFVMTFDGFLYLKCKFFSYYN